jgi:hypothetical protein
MSIKNSFRITAVAITANATVEISMSFFILLLGKLVKGAHDGNGGGCPLKQYNSISDQAPISIIITFLDLLLP